MTESPPPPESVFARSWALLSGNWSIVLPGIVVGIIVGLLHAFLGYGGFFVMLLSLLGLIITLAYTTGMAAAAWSRGVTTLDDGAAAWRRDGAQVFLAVIGLFVLAVVAFWLSFITVGLAMLAFVLFTLYTMPAVIIGRQRGFSAIAQSFQLTAARFLPTLVVALLLGVVFVVLGFVALIFAGVPFLGPLIAGIIQQAVAAYATLVIVGEYLALSRSTPLPGDAYQTQSQSQTAYQAQPRSPYEPPL